MLQLLPQKSWDDFQYLCHDLWRLMWNDPNTQLNGRQGHPQQGVDIFGMPYYADNYYGVQCKGRNANYNSKLTQEEVIAECNEANDKFNPGLEALVVATTSARGPKIQEQCRNLTKSHTYPFKVSVWSWDDIEEEIQYRPELMEKYYPNVKPEHMPDSMILDYTSIEDKVYAFFTRPNIQRAISYDYRHFLYQVVSELADNAFSKGKATHVKISFNDSSLIIEDDGAEFNPVQLLEIEGRGGAYTLRKIVSQFGDSLKFEYTHDNQNHFSLVFPRGVLSTLIDEDYNITLDDNKFFGRPFAHSLALHHFSNIPAEKKRIKIVVTALYGLAMSNACEYFETALQNLKGDQSIEVLYTKGYGDTDHLEALFAGRPITFKKW